MVGKRFAGSFWRRRWTTGSRRASTWTPAELIDGASACTTLNAVATAVGRRRRTRELQQRFGPEYDRAVTEQPNRRQAERDLRQRERHHDELELRDLEPSVDLPALTRRDAAANPLTDFIDLSKPPHFKTPAPLPRPAIWPFPGLR